MPPMRARGGKVVTKSVKKRESGGRATISADSLRAARDERSKAEDKLTDRNVNTGLAALSGAATMMPGSGRLLRGANALFTANNVGSMVGHTRRRNEHLAEADRIERGQVTPGQEDRKHGGAVSKTDAAVKIAKAEESPGRRASGGSVNQKDGEQLERMNDRLGHVGTTGGATARASGGPVSPPKGFDAGAGGAKGRMEKIKEYGK